MQRKILSDVLIRIIFSFKKSVVIFSEVQMLAGKILRMAKRLPLFFSKGTCCNLCFLIFVDAVISFRSIACHI